MQSCIYWEMEMLYWGRTIPHRPPATLSRCPLHSLPYRFHSHIINQTYTYHFNNDHAAGLFFHAFVCVRSLKLWINSAYVIMCLRFVQLITEFFWNITRRVDLSQFCSSSADIRQSMWSVNLTSVWFSFTNFIFMFL